VTAVVPRTGAPSAQRASRFGRPARLLLAVVVGGALLAMGGVVAGFAAVHRGGNVAVELEQTAGDQVRIAVPAVLVRLAIALAPASLFEPAVADELRPLLPALRAGWQELARAPDGPLAELRAPNERLLVEKRGNRLSVLVVTDGTAVRVALPLATLGPLFAKLERAAETRPAG
jgi:hypothetical protein